MWDTLRIVSDAIEAKMSDKDKAELNAKIYGMLSGGHFDEEHAMEAVSKMYYTDKDGAKRYAPYWTIPQVEEVYESVKEEIPEAYNEWDFFVVMQMQKADLCPLFQKWWPNATPEQMDEKFAQSAVNWLNDEDNPYGEKKAWGYLHGK